MRHSTRTTDSRLVVGLLFLIIGIYFLLNNFNLIPFSIPRYLISWQSLLIVIGLLIIGTSDKKGGGITLVVIGGAFMVSDIFDLSIRDLIRQFWPLIFVIIGVSLLVRRSQEKKRVGNLTHETSSLDFIDEAAILGGNEKIITSEEFRGGRITSIFGSNEINFINSHLAPGVHVIDVFVLFGGVEITVPSDWSVKVDISPIVGGFEDKRKYQQMYSPESGQQLIIRGQVIMGGGEIRNA
ncbi:MAG: DUF5668 domain-containing protein [Cyclobacteriaceae bacterium]